MEQRKTVIIPEKKAKIDKIKTKYNNMQMDDKTALKIHRLEVANSILSKAALIAGVITAVDLIVPDPVLGLDEAVLAGATGLLKTSSVIVENKIDSLSKNGTMDLKNEEVIKLGNDISNVVNAVKNKKNTHKTV